MKLNTKNMKKKIKKLRKINTLLNNMIKDDDFINIVYSEGNKMVKYFETFNTYSDDINELLEYQYIVFDMFKRHGVEIDSSILKKII